jgi:hypothetical protein
MLPRLSLNSQSCFSLLSSWNYRYILHPALSTLSFLPLFPLTFLEIFSSLPLFLLPYLIFSSSPDEDEDGEMEEGRRRKEDRKRKTKGRGRKKKEGRTYKEEAYIIRHSNKIPFLGTYPHYLLFLILYI